MGKLQKVLAILFISSLALFASKPAEAECWTCVAIVVIDMSGNPIGFTEACLESYIFNSRPRCHVDQWGYCVLSGSPCRSA